MMMKRIDHQIMKEMTITILLNQVEHKVYSRVDCRVPVQPLGLRDLQLQSSQMI